MKNKFLFIVATHGDEGFSLDIIKDLERKFPKEAFGYDWIIGNPKAFEKKQRFIDKDLNRCAPGNIKSQIYEEKRAAEIVELSKKYDFIVDIHGSTSKCGIITIVTYPSFQNLALAVALGIKKNIIWYSKSSLENGPLTQYVKCPAIEIECGPQDNNCIKRKLNELLQEFITVQKKKENLAKILKKYKEAEFFAVYGKKEGKHNQKLIDFKPLKMRNETFYPFLANQYPGVLCYKTKRVNIEKYFLY